MRARVPSALAIAQVVLRIVSSGCSVLALVMLVYCSANYGKDFAVGYIAVRWLYHPLIIHRSWPCQ